MSDKNNQNDQNSIPDGPRNPDEFRRAWEYAESEEATREYQNADPLDRVTASVIVLATVLCGCKKHKGDGVWQELAYTHCKAAVEEIVSVFEEHYPEKIAASLQALEFCIEQGRQEHEEAHAAIMERLEAALPQALEAIKQRAASGKSEGRLAVDSEGNVHTVSDHADLDGPTADHPPIFATVGKPVEAA